MNWPCVLSALLTLSTYQVSAQYSRRLNQLGFGVGLSYPLLRSAVLSPRTFSGPGAVGCVYWRTAGARSRYHIQLSYSTADLMSAPGNNLFDRRGMLEVAYHHQLWAERQRSLRWFAGVVWSNIASNRTLELPNFGFASNSEDGEFLSTLQLSGLVEWPRPAGRWSGQLGVAGLGYAYRRGYALSPAYGELASLRSFNHAQVRASYERYLNERLTLRLDYQSSWTRLAPPRQLGVLLPQGIISLALAL